MLGLEIVAYSWSPSDFIAGQHNEYRDQSGKDFEYVLSLRMPFYTFLTWVYWLGIQWE